jgi:predicted Zn-dependent protease with MMP-like domain
VTAVDAAAAANLFRLANDNHSAPWSHLETLASAEVESTLSRLPAPLRERALALPITLQRRPNPAQIRDGIEPDTLGLFVGPEFAFEESAAEPLPPQIILFLDNLWDQAEADEECFRQEVRTTLLHELGHYLGLDEDDLFERGLE